MNNENHNVVDNNRKKIDIRIMLCDTKFQVSLSFIKLKLF